MMRSLFFLPLLLVCGCANFVHEKPRNLSGFGRPDALVIAAALVDFRRDDDPGETLLVERRYFTDKEGVSSKQIAFDLSKGDKVRWQVPEDARLDLECRTGQEKAVPKLRTLPRSVAMDLHPYQGREGNQRLWKRYPNHETIRLYPPGYTPNDKRALIVFWASHRQLIELLELRGGSWQVVNRHVLVFPD